MAPKDDGLEARAREFLDGLGVSKCCEHPTLTHPLVTPEALTAFARQLCTETAARVEAGILEVLARVDGAIHVQKIGESEDVLASLSLTVNALCRAAAARARKGNDDGGEGK